ncbi:hypothetical protein IU451_29570 [Nocardia cyriacigeorgica]|uniref:hypothetical protein n=1 Tax=Nocardia cyriacigeorgica TaxID=135487 RepID=UPI0018939A7E|nr:hypothetical protein [Nocardia cyriacigeorgica]MBF6326651.1 hypothetical protein [Nocardia cyriacigeorgica]
MIEAQDRVVPFEAPEIPAANESVFADEAITVRSGTTFDTMHPADGAKGVSVRTGWYESATESSPRYGRKRAVEPERDFDSSMAFPTRWDPFLADTMTVELVCH